MLRIRINNLLNRLESIESQYPGLVLNVLNNQKLELFIPEYIREMESTKVKQIINAFFELTSNTEQEIIGILCSKFSRNTEKLLSTTAYGRIIGINAKPTLFEFLTATGLITRADSKYQLTEEGLKYGGYVHTDNNERFIGWRKVKLDSITKSLKEELLRGIDFKLYHMTHFSNLEGILKNGLLSHNQVSEYTDISNKDVNKRREKDNNPHKISLHQYVPLYFNPRNAMLFSCQKQFGEDVVILEIDKDVTLNDYTLFSEGNAARQDSKITTNMLDLANYSWEKINSSSWSDNQIGSDEDLKSMMMSECLILNRFSSKSISKVFCSSEYVHEKLSLLHLNDIEVKINKKLFF